MLIFWILLVVVAVIIFAAAYLCDTVKPAAAAYKKMVKKPTWPSYKKDKKILPLFTFVHNLFTISPANLL